MTVLLTGFLTCLALIVAIGPQSAWLLRQGLLRDRVGLAVLCCVVGDLLLIGLGTAGVGAVLEHAPWLLQVLRWAGVAYLLWFAWRSFASAAKVRTGLDVEDDSSTAPEPVQGAGEHDDALPSGEPGTTTATLPRVQTRPGTRRSRTVSTVGAVVGTGLTVSVLNPHAWVDTMVVLGTMANSFGAEKWFFAAGALGASCLWFTLLGYGGSALAGLLNRPRTWQVIDAGVGVTMLVVAGLLAFGG
ncbi:LysE/ArgO family amino acid transporter [Nesterenkonia sp. HG001]|uniref:LysE/ArgO family amino acid transporter n=1 Tax=Nesterenkonia sp. HG001 TaxID=2983207 RepID=UPI002AC78C38|nr:LysE family transporter [Nesterenkonia sp. HG001]MDZ5077140.1 LysE family transporter [Nesterenkonia sp. HG001]